MPCGRKVRSGWGRTVFSAATVPADRLGERVAGASGFRGRRPAMRRADSIGHLRGATRAASPLAGAIT